MSTASLTQFLDTLSEHRDLRVQLQQRIQQADDGASYSTIRAFAGERGFDLAEADLEALDAALSADSSTLSDDQLDQISGGNWFTDLAPGVQGRMKDTWHELTQWPF